MSSSFCSDSGHQTDGEVVTGSEKQPEQIRKLHPEDADCDSAQWWRPDWAGQDGVRKKKNILHIQSDLSKSVYELSCVLRWLIGCFLYQEPETLYSQNHFQLY